MCYSECGLLRRAPQDRHHPAGVIALIVVIAGLLVGLVMGALGGGGAIMTVPLLTFALGLPPTHATVGSLVVRGHDVIGRGRDA